MSSAADRPGLQRFAAGLWRRSGVRQMVLQALVMLVAFGVAGAFAGASIERVTEAATRRQVLGEANSMLAEWRQHGGAHLPHTVNKRTRLWRGFEYSLVSADGRLIAGDPRIAYAVAGWRETPRGDPSGILSFTRRLPDGTWLSVGQDEAIERGQLGALNRTLWLCGAGGVLIALTASILLYRRTWRRVDQLGRAAALVTAGDLDIRAPQRRARNADDIDDLTRDFNGMLDRLVRLVAQVRQVTTDVAHDLRTPLTRVRHRLERLEAAAADHPALAESVRQIDADIAETLRTFDALLHLADIESASTPPGATDLADVAARVTEAYRPDIEEGGRSVEARFTSAKVFGDADLLAQLVANLLENAMRHTPTGTRIRVVVEADAGAARLSVVDNGPGVPEHLRAAALAPLVRLEPSRNTPGSGLGLSIVAAVATRHRAQLTLGDAAPGLAVTATFPAA